MRILSAIFGTACLLGSAAAQADRAGHATVSPQAIEFLRPGFGRCLPSMRCAAMDRGSNPRAASTRERFSRGENGPAVVPGDSEKSLLIQAIRYAHEDIKMPPRGRCPTHRSSGSRAG